MLPVSRWRITFSFLTIALISLTSPAHALDWPGGASACKGDDCSAMLPQGEGKKAYEQIKQEIPKEASDPEGSSKARYFIALSAFATAGVGITWGVGKYKAYQEGLAAAANQATALRAETHRVAKAIKLALAPELERIAADLVARERSAKLPMKKMDLEIELFNQLSDPQAKARVAARLENTLGSSADEVAENVFNTKNLETLSGRIQVVMRNAWKKATFDVAKAAASMGEVAATDIAGAIAPKIAPKTLQYAAKLAAEWVEKEAAAICTSSAGKVLGKAAGVVFGFYGVVAQTLLESSGVKADTSADFYARHPDLLFTLPDAQARQLLEENPAVAAEVVKLRDLMRVDGELSPDDDRELHASPLEEAAGSCGIPAPGHTGSIGPRCGSA